MSAEAEAGWATAAHEEAARTLSGCCPSWARPLMSIRRLDPARERLLAAVREFAA